MENGEDIFDQPGFQLEGFWVTLIFCAIVGGPFLLAFFIGRRVMPWFYIPKSSSFSLEPGAPDKKVANSWFGFIPFVLKYSNVELFKEKGGIDTVIYLRFLRQATCMFGIFTCFGIAAILPVNVMGTNKQLDSGDTSKVSGINTLTMSNLESKSNKMILHSVTVIAYTLVVFYFQWQLARLSVDLNIQEHQKLDSKRARTVMVSDLPKKNAKSSDALYQLFSKMYRKGLTNCHVVPRNRGLRELVNMRENVHQHWIMRCDKYIEKGAKKRSTINTIKDLDFFDLSHFWNRKKKEEGLRKTYIRVLKEMSKGGKQERKIAKEMEEDVRESIEQVAGEEEEPHSPMLTSVKHRDKIKQKKNKLKKNLKEKITKIAEGDSIEEVDLPNFEKVVSRKRAKQDLFLAHRKRQFDRYKDREESLLVFPEEIDREEMPDDFFDAPPPLPEEQQQPFGLDAIDFYEKVLEDLDKRIKIRQKRIKRSLERKEEGEKPLHPFFAEGKEKQDLESRGFSTEIKANNSVEMKPLTVNATKTKNFSLNSSSDEESESDLSDSEESSRPITPEKAEKLEGRGRTDAEDGKSNEKFKGGMTRVGFVTFRYVATAMACSQSLHKRDPGQCRVIPAPDPQNIEWENLNYASFQKNIRLLICSGILAVIFLFYAIPITFLSSFSSLRSLANIGFLRGAVTAIAKNFFLRGVIGGFLPSAAINLFQQILPWILRLVLKHVTYNLKTDLDMAISKAFYVWLLLNVFLLNFITGSIISTISDFINDPAANIETLAVSLPSQAESFIEYIMIQGLIGYPLVLFRIIDFIVYKFKLKFSTNTERERIALRKETVETNYSFDSQFPQELVVFSIGLAYSTVAPLVALFSFFHFALAFFSAKNHFVFVFKQSYEGYNLALFLLNVYSVSLFCYHLIMLGIFITKVFPGGIVVSTVAFFLAVAFRVWLRRYTKPIHFIPLVYCNPEKLHPDERGKIEEITNMFTDPVMNKPQYIYESIQSGWASFERLFDRFNLKTQQLSQQSQSFPFVFAHLYHH
eukprot:TRINITY_DN5522_c0_g1_i2.p1 TRINITY_DN5522_c0_g1~~TRINITY_DN5522_c0_g1_i2.p1  ORF type:complete len:1030 (+),score=356.14 TRINITY_DN5522_c0_g1_i2:199-3288(+)